MERNSTNKTTYYAKEKEKKSFWEAIASQKLS